MKFDPHGALTINDSNRILIVVHFLVHLYCCSKQHKLSTILMVNVANLVHFVT